MSRKFKSDPCMCEDHADINPDISAHYNNSFIPTGWSLDYDTLASEDKPRFIIMEGKCSECGKYMRYQMPLAANLTWKSLLEHIYERMESARPLAYLHPDGTYAASCEERSGWYEAQDHMDRSQRNQQFFRLFHTEDRAYVRTWLDEKKMVYNDPAYVLRETGAEFFLKTLRAAQRAGELDKFVPYVQWVEKEVLPEETELTCDQFKFMIEMLFADSGRNTKIRCFLKGKFDDSGRSRLDLATLWAVDGKKESIAALCELAAVLGRYGSRHIGYHRHSYMSQEDRIKEAGQPALLEALVSSAPPQDDELPF